MPFCLKFSYTHQFYLIYREIPGLKIWLQFHFVYLSRTSKKFSPPDRCTLCWFSEFSTETSTWFHNSYRNPHLCFKFSIYLSYFRSLKIIRLGEKLLLKTFSKFLYKLLLARDTYLPSIKFLLAYWAFKTSFYLPPLEFFSQQVHKKYKYSSESTRRKRWTLPRCWLWLYHLVDNCFPYAFSRIYQQARWYQQEYFRFNEVIETSQTLWDNAEADIPQYK